MSVEPAQQERVIGAHFQDGQLSPRVGVWGNEELERGAKERKGGGARVTSPMTAVPDGRHPGLSHFLSVSPQGQPQLYPTPALTPTPFQPPRAKKKCLEKTLGSTLFHPQGLRQSAAEGDTGGCTLMQAGLPAGTWTAYPAPTQSLTKPPRAISARTVCPFASAPSCGCLHSVAAALAPSCLPQEEEHFLAESNKR